MYLMDFLKKVSSLSMKNGGRKEKGFNHMAETTRMGGVSVFSCQRIDLAGGLFLCRVTFF